MGVGEGALRPCALGFEVSRPVPELAFPERAFLFQAICLAACPNPASYKRIKAPTWEAWEHETRPAVSRGGVNAEQSHGIAREIAQKES